MRRIKALIAAIIIASTLFINVHKADVSDEDETPTAPMTPVYEVPSVYAGIHSALDERRQAKIAEVKRKLLVEARDKAERERRAAKEHERRAKSAREELRKQALSLGASAEVSTQTYEATFYTAYCPTGCTGVTATGLDVSITIYSPAGHRIIAVDPAQIQLGSLVELTFADGSKIRAVAEDTGGAIKGRRIDVLVASRDEAYRLGRQAVEVRILRKGR